MRGMNSRFAIMMALGLGVLGLFWWKAVQVEDTRAAEIAAITGCAQAPNCPAEHPVCLTGFNLTEGVCSSPCTMRNQCPDEWCCPAPTDEAQPRLCAPPGTCAILGLH